MIGYVQANVIAERWDMSMRQVQRLCIEGRVEGALNSETHGLFPKTLSIRHARAKKNPDENRKRRKKNKIAISP